MLLYHDAYTLLNYGVTTIGYYPAACALGSSIDDVAILRTESILSMVSQCLLYFKCTYRMAQNFVGGKY